jgi:CBS domain-containing protein
MVTVNDLIGAKTDASRYAIKANETVYRAIRLMADRRIGAVLVVDQGLVTGIFTERDYIMRVEVDGLSAKDTFVRDVMTDKMYTVTTQTTIAECMALMVQRHIRHLPVVENGQLMGIISMRDAMGAALEELGADPPRIERYALDTGFRG